MTPLPSNKISRNNSRHSANPNYDYDLTKNRSNPNYITEKDFDIKSNKLSRKNTNQSCIDFNDEFKKEDK